MDDCASQISHESFVAQDYPVRDGGAYQLTESPMPKKSHDLIDNLVDPFCSGSPGSMRSHDVSASRAPLEKSPPLRPNRRREADVELGVRGTSKRSLPDPQSRMSMIHHWKSPIGKTIPLSTSFLFGVLMFRSPRIWI